MGIEDWNIEQNVAKRNRPKNEEETKLSRRKFLKVAGVAGLALAGGKVLSKLDDIFDFEEEKKDNDLERKSIKEKIISESKKEIKEAETAEEIAAEFLRVYETNAIKRRYDPKVFTKDFFIAQQFEESRGKKEAESGVGAKGVYQVMPDATQYVADYLTDMEKRTKDLPKGRKVEYYGPEEISEELANEMGDTYQEYADYGRAVGKLYLLAIHDKESKYNRGKSKDVFRGKSAREQQKLLLLSYQSGPTMRHHPEKAGKWARQYVKGVFEKMDIIADLRNRFEKAGMSRDLDYAILKILRELDRAENKNSDDNPDAQKEAINYWLKKLQEAHMALWRKTGESGDVISNDKIREIFG